MIGVKKKVIGLDIADHSIEAVELSGSNNNIKVASLGRIRLLSGVVVRGQIKDEEKLLKAIEKVITTAKPREINDHLEVVFGIPESQSYIQVLKIPVVDSRQEKAEVRKAITKNIPVPIEGLSYDYKILGKVDGGQEVLVVAAERDIVKIWQAFFKKARLTVKFFDFENLASFRGLNIENKKAPICLVDIGSSTTSIIVFDNGYLRYSFGINRAGRHFTRALADKFGITKEEAEKKKVKIDLKKMDTEALVVIKSLQPILEEIKATLTYYEKKSGKKAEQVILIGGSAKLKGLADYLSSNLDLPVEVGRPILRSRGTKLLYVGALGLAMRQISSKWKKDPVIHLEKKSKVAKKENKKIVKMADFFQEEKKEKPATNSSSKSKLIILLVVIVVGIIFVSLSFWYRGSQREKSQVAENSVIDQYTVNNLVKVVVPVAIVPEEYTPDRVRGRLITEEIPIAQSAIAPETQLRGGEVLWPEILSSVQKDSKTTIFSWLVMSGDNANDLLLKAVKENVGDKFLFQKLEYSSVVATDNPNIYLLVGEVEIFMTQKLVDSDFTGLDISEPPPAVEPESKTVIIGDTGVGWLNVRSGAGTSFSVVKRVNTGEKYELLSENKGWYKIRIDGEITGWISGKYAEKIDL